MQADEELRRDLAARLATIDALAAAGRAADAARDIYVLRRMAFAGGFYPAATVAHVLETALGANGRGPLIRGWLAILGDAVRSERQDARACETFAAACSVRLAG